MNIPKAERVFELLSDSNRIRIIKELSGSNELCACKLLELVDCKQATLSHHMNLMVKEGIVSSRKDGKWVHYSLNKKKIEEVFSFLLTSSVKERK